MPACNGPAKVVSQPRPIQEPRRAEPEASRNLIEVLERDIHAPKLDESNVSPIEAGAMRKFLLAPPLALPLLANRGA